MSFLTSKADSNNPVLLREMDSYATPAESEDFFDSTLRPAQLKGGLCYPGFLRISQAVHGVSLRRVESMCRSLHTRADPTTFRSHALTRRNKVVQVGTPRPGSIEEASLQVGQQHQQQRHFGLEVVRSVHTAAVAGSSEKRSKSTANTPRVSFAGDNTSVGKSSIRKASSRSGLRRIDSLEAEASRVKSMETHHGNQNLPLSVTLTLAYQTIGVVYGDLGTSPLYVFASTFPDRVPSEKDILGALSLILYTFTLIPLIKYVFIVLRANDHGNGGTFALYSLVSRFARISVSPNQVPEDQEVSSYKLSTPTDSMKRSQKLKEALQNHRWLRTLIVTVAILGTCMVIGDGVLTPSISVLSAIQGIKVNQPSLDQNVIVVITCVILFALFNIQRFGTDKVGYLFSPVVLVWFISIALIGIYNIIKQDPSVFRALNPYHMYEYMSRNKKQGWISLGGIVLCVTGTEAMFADLGHFSVKSIQIAFTTLVYPCLVAAYTGQAAYLLKHPEDVSETFYNSIPGKLDSFSATAASFTSQAVENC
ncbi:hypothetical protein AXG93_3891s1010 [Marchantia polymorpha subsp. ruderalis]|uniref:K+ potassium transporter integral membrane domain-containing protein n=1 Tax=Marchantia polymorpha subsp. ruderalis TaxID=1480154 RepID=A0A176WLF6_MARPO|nr:hypothetical protein AXG93_3891s1010 [Marchantia polymorpha subsp. ruderalis]